MLNHHAMLGPRTYDIAREEHKAIGSHLIQGLESLNPYPDCRQGPESTSPDLGFRVPGNFPMVV